MRRNKLKAAYKPLALAGLITAVHASTLTAQIRYKLVVPEVAGSPISQTSSIGNELNENGETLLNRITTFAVWKDGAVSHIASSHTDQPGSLTRVNSASINASQQVVGSKTYRVKTEEGKMSHTFPFYWDPTNGIVDLTELGPSAENGTGNTRLLGINRDGLSFGTTDVLGGSNAFTWSFEEGQTDIPALSFHEGRSVTEPTAISDSGLVVGSYRRFLDSFDAYAERAFVYTDSEGSRDLGDLNPDFFEGTHISANDVNSSSMIVGEQDRFAYIYDLANHDGRAIPAARADAVLVQALAVSESGLVAGAQLLAESNQLSPILWTENAGSIDLLPQLQKSIEAILPAGLSIHQTRVTPKSINSRGQISATLDTTTSFSREVILQPTLAFQWTSMQETIENGVRGATYRFEKEMSSSLIPVSELGYTIGFECSADMVDWQEISRSGTHIRHTETDDYIELFVPFAGCLFVRAKLEAIAE